MNILPPATCRRLQKLPQDQSVWEGDRQTVDPQANFAADWFESDPTREDDAEERDCILWADGSQGMVRAMDLVAVGSGSEATVRTLLQAMEHPHSPAAPSRPQKIVVRDRELQFYLRGILRDLGISVECVPSLPFLDEVFQTLTQARKGSLLTLAPQWLSALQQNAQSMWKCAPWELLEDHQILAIELNQWDIETLYVSTMGMAEMEYGLLFYRSLDSLKRFREAVINDETAEGLEEVFLLQDCLYLTYDQGDDEADNPFLPIRVTPDWEDLEPTFGSIHPLEGMRPFLYDEEAQVMLAGLDAIEQFVNQYRRKLKGGKFPALTGTYKIEGLGNLPRFDVKVSSLPELSQELLALDGDEDEEDSLDSKPFLQDDLVPEGAMYWLGYFSWDFHQSIKPILKTYQSAPEPLKQGGEGLSILMIQTSRPKAKALMEQIQASGGIECISFGAGEDFFGNRFDLAIVKTVDQALHLFSDYPAQDPTHRAAYKKWTERCRKNNQTCALILAEGITGVSKGNPEPKHVVAMYEVPLVAASDLGLSTLQLMPKLDFPF
jgi:hypothetical protein